MDRAVRSSPSALVFGLILLAPAFSTGFVAPRLPFSRPESIAADPNLVRDRVLLQTRATRATRATQGARSRTAVPTQNPFACAMTGPNEGKALTCMRPWSHQPHLPHIRPSLVHLRFTFLRIFCVTCTIWRGTGTGMPVCRRQRRTKIYE